MCGIDLDRTQRIHTLGKARSYCQKSIHEHRYISWNKGQIRHAKVTQTWISCNSIVIYLSQLTRNLRVRTPTVRFADNHKIFIYVKAMRHCNNISFLTSTVRLFLFKIVPSREVFLDLQGSKEISRVNKRNATVRFSLVGFIDSWWRTVVKPGFQRIWKAIKRCWLRAFSVDPKHHRQLNPFSLAIAIMPRLFDSILLWKSRQVHICKATQAGR